MWERVWALSYLRRNADTFRQCRDGSTVTTISEKGIEKDHPKAPYSTSPTPPHQISTEFRRSEFAITETEDKAIAAAAIIGDRRSPVIG